MGKVLFTSFIAIHYSLTTKMISKVTKTKSRAQMPPPDPDAHAWRHQLMFTRYTLAINEMPDTKIFPTEPRKRQLSREQETIAYRMIPSQMTSEPKRRTS